MDRDQRPTPDVAGATAGDGLKDNLTNTVILESQTEVSMRRHNSGLNVNFDGLTDSVTNLVGSLILLVVLVVAITQPKRLGVSDLPPPDRKIGAQQPIDTLLEGIRLTRDETQDVESDIERYELRLPEIADEINQLRRQVTTQGD
jgi:hypothetical protein